MLIERKSEFFRRHDLEEQDFVAPGTKQAHGTGQLLHVVKTVGKDDDQAAPSYPGGQLLEIRRERALARRSGLARMLVINDMDGDNINFRKPQ